MDAARVDVVGVASLATKFGIAVIPVREDGSKRPDLPSWAIYQERAPTRDELRDWFAEYERTGLGWVTGAVSGNLECLDFDTADAWDELSELLQSVDAGLFARLTAYMERTPKGAHLFWRCAEIERNLKLARAADGGSRIETRGEGGFVVVAPSFGGVHPSGMPYQASGTIEDIATITPDERAIVLGLARSLDRMPRTVDEPQRELVEHDGARPGDIYASRVTWGDVLQPAGWAHVMRHGTEDYWRRPNAKTRGVDATTNYSGSDMLYVFSTSALPFEPERGYGKFSAYAHLYHGGDYAAAARQLASEGYCEEVPILVASQEPELAPKTEPEKKSAVGRSDTYTFRHGWPKGHFVERYISYCAGRTDAAHEYHEAAALSLLAAFSPNVRTWFPVWPEGLATNLYFLLIGGTTAARKSTSLAYARKMARAVEPSVVMAERMTPEAMVEQLSVREKHGSILIGDEFGEQLAQMLKPNGYMAATTEILLNVYGRRQYKYTRRSKRMRDGTMQSDADEIIDPHLTILTASTGAIFESVSSRDVQTGLLPRFALVYPDTFPPRRRIYEESPNDAEDEAWLVDYLQRLHLWSSEIIKAGNEVRAVWSSAAMEMVDQASERIENMPDEIVQRLAATTAKIAMLSSLGEQVPRGTLLSVEKADAEQAARVVRRLEESAMRFADEIGGLSADQRKTEQAIDRVRRMLYGAGGRASRSEIGKALKMSARSLDDLEATMADRGIVRIMQLEPDGRGRPAKVWGLQ